MGLSDASDYTLAFFRADGEIEKIELENLLRAQVDLPTREGFYDLGRDGFGYKKRFNAINILVAAFSIVTSVHPANLSLYSFKRYGTIYEPAFYFLKGESEVLNQFGSDYDFTDSNDLAHYFTTIFNELGSDKILYITAGLHPLDQLSSKHAPDYKNFVTTVECFLRALQVIERAGLRLDYSPEGVRALDSNENQVELRLA
jgi:hypothetical protein